jgi:hypothetical protein
MRQTLVSQYAAAITLSAMMAGCSSSLPPSQPIAESQSLANAQHVADLSDETMSAFADTTTSPYKHIKIPANDSIQTDLISTVPEGYYKPAKGWGTFNIPKSPKTCGYAKTGPCNLYDGFGFSGSGTNITLKASVANPVYAYTLMNAYTPPAGVQLATIEFIGEGGASVSYPLVAGKDIRDFYDGQYENALANGVTGVVARNVFSCVDPTKCLGGGQTGDVNTGRPGKYRVDEQQFSLAGLNGETLTQIILTDTNNGSQPILLGLTIESN